MNDPESTPAAERSRTNPRTRVRAEARIDVQRFEVEPYDQTAGPALMEIRLSETFTGSIEGESIAARALQLQRSDRSASLVSLARFHGSVDGRQGTFVLQGSGSVENGRIAVKWFVVPGSGTDELAWLRGEGGFEGEFGKRSVGTLDYWFE